MGYAIAVFILKFISASLLPPLAPWMPFLCAILMGFLGIFLIKTVVKSILFIAGLFFGIAIFSIYSVTTSGTIYPFGIEMIIRNISFWAIISGAIFGILFILFEKWFVILYTSGWGIPYHESTSCTLGDLLWLDYCWRRDTILFE
jgi:hypothetical protein